ncbi:Histamine H2 receptor [Holothuria leucospilota]|uniref:Histamine H2 receptor n=1 Tax=Holothuria leucospilota TaxID=206669 RepID=A0A9Q1GVX4_HOLLE|nr:Histamine H2 receptor [Holothuria leucospilota]
MLNGTTSIPTLSWDEGTDRQGVYLRVGLRGLFIYIGVYIPIIVFIVVGNGLILLSFLRFKKVRTVSNYYIFALAGVDLLTGLISIPLTICSRLIVSDFTCQASTRSYILFPVYFCGEVSVCILMGITIDRYIAISYPFRYPTMMTPKTTKRFILFLFILTTVHSSLPLWSFGSDRYQWVCTTGPYESSASNIQIISGSLLIPIFILFMTIAYGRIFYIAFVKKSAVSKPSKFKSAHWQKRLRTTLTCAIVIVAFTVCWIPNSCKIIFEIFFAKDAQSLLAIQTFGEWFAFVSSCTNPVIYGLRNENFKQAYRRVFRDCCYRSESIS